MGGKIFNFLQMSVGYVLSSSTHADLARAYNCDVTYANNNELGFDLCTWSSLCVIDEARIPPIISNTTDQNTGMWNIIDINR